MEPTGNLCGRTFRHPSHAVPHPLTKAALRNRCIPFASPLPEQTPCESPRSIHVTTLRPACTHTSESANTPTKSPIHRRRSSSHSNNSLWPGSSIPAHTCLGSKKGEAPCWTVPPSFSAPARCMEPATPDRSRSSCRAGNWSQTARRAPSLARSADVLVGTGGMRLNDWPKSSIHSLPTYLRHRPDPRIPHPKRHSTP